MSNRSNEAFIMEYRAAIALNNMAVALMERRAYTESLTTLIDCCSLMESALRQQHMTSSSDPSDRFRKVEEMIHKSSCRLSKATAFSPQTGAGASSLRDSHPDTTNTAFVVVNHDGTCLESRAWLQQDDSRTSPIRLEALDFHNIEERNPELDSCMMIFNLGIAYLCLARSAHSGSLKLRDTSATIFRMAYDNVTKLDTLQQLMESQPESFESRLHLDTRLLLAHMILRHAIQAYLDSGKLSEAWETQEQLVRLANTIHELGVCDIPEGITRNVAGPAPAA